MSYGDNHRKLVIWYDFEEFQRAFPQWIQPNPDRPPFENISRFNRRLRTDIPEEEDSENQEGQDQARRGMRGSFSRGRRARGRVFRGPGSGFRSGSNSQVENKF